jgi:ribonuclease BN (tRNA processing enzyme)
MKVRVLGAFGSEGLGQRPSSFLVNERVLLDAGTVSGALTVKEQLAIEHAIVSHSHLDHTCGLAYLTETLGICPPRVPLTVASVEPVIAALRTSMFNNVMWPDFSRIPSADKPVLKFRSLVEDAEQRVDELWVTPIAVVHTVPTFGFVVHDGSSGFVYSGDTGPTAALWQAARSLTSIRAVILECAYPDRMADLAGLAGHMTPSLIRRELDKLPTDVPVWIFHIKPQYQDETVEELSGIDTGRLVVLEQDKTYTV